METCFDCSTVTIIVTICSLFHTVFWFNFPVLSRPFFIRYGAPNYPFLSTPKKSWQSFNPLTSRSDQLPISPYNITHESSIKVKRIKEMIFNLLSSWFLNKFSLSVLQEMYRAWRICILMLGCKGLKAQTSFSLC